jgi:hypothetical protein
MQITGVLRGDAALMDNLTALAKNAPHIIGAALEEEAGVELEEMIQRTPRDTGALRSSGGHGRWFLRRGMVAVLIRFGGPTAWYAVIVEKAKGNTHVVGQRRYMGSVVSEARKFLLGRIARNVGMGRKWLR